MKTITIRVDDAEYEGLKAVAAKIGNGATPTGIVRQLIREAIALVTR